MESIPSSQTFKCSPSHPKHVVPLDFNNVPKLPDSHAWKTTLPIDDHQLIDPFTEEPLPIIDLAKPDVFNLVRHACEKWGVFQVTNHGIPVSFFYEIECQTRRLFSLPAERKLLAVRSPEGFTGYGLPRISPFFPKLMWSEGFSIIGSPVEHASQLWPEDHSKFCEVMEQYQAKMKGLSEKIVAAMLSSLGLTHEDVKWFEPKNGCDQTTCVLQLNSYPVCPDPGRAMGLAPHTDSSLLTLLYQSWVSGLQVYRDGAGWVAVEPVEGALVVNVGDLMHIVSNGKFKPVLHRAVVNNTHHRVSTAYFYGPPRDVKVSALRKLIDHAHPPLYRPVTWKEYLEAKSKHFNKALESIRL
ncbi:gibberellin 3-beta-dioxygenase 3-like [Durio zibethinus]|uniref:gibberellin 3beta-dioxygenase n=1 Tax=Durio zibethinus TaxID=66656 RepID=A0A6P5ZFS3_DURZI|nr:gibberellin 3-beta-dioxygenase 3-like [Durio zibethinus]